MVSIRRDPYEPRMYKHVILNGYIDKPYRDYELSQGGDVDYFDGIADNFAKAHAFNLSSVYDGIINKVQIHRTNLYPPFPVFWLEGLNYPIRDDGFLDAAHIKSLPKMRFGIFVRTEKKDEGGYVFAISSFTQNTQNGVVCGPVTIGAIQSDKNGELIGGKGNEYLVSVKAFANIPLSVAKDDIGSDCVSVLNFLGLVNASNVSCPKQIFDVNHHTKRRLDAKKANRYHILKIHKPGQKIKKDSGTGENEGKMPLHVVRGHLADYTENGLFGKYFGTYFIPSHVRGNEKNGKVTKDYALV